jgi:ABC-type branched-subunit amino acid transport system permease subunit
MINPYWELVILLVLINVIFALSLNLILGYNGQFALGHAGFLLIGAYASGVATTALGWPLWAGFVLAVLLSIAGALIIGYPSLRLRGDYLAIATLGFGEIIRIVTLTLPAGTFGGPTGMKNVRKIGDYLPVPESMNGIGNFIATIVFAAAFVGLLGWAVWSFARYAGRKLARWVPERAVTLAVLLVVAGLAGLNAKRLAATFLGIFQFNLAFRQAAFDSKQWALLLFYVLVVAGVILLLRNYLASAAGRAAIAIREDEIATSNLGIDIFWVKLRNFMFGCALAGLAGALTAHTLDIFRPADFDFFRSVDVLLMVVLGGMGSITGSIIGATAVQILPEVLRFVGQWRLVIYSLVLILFMLFRPGGLIGRREIGELIRFKFLRRDQDNPEGGPGNPDDTGRPGGSRGVAPEGRVNPEAGGA